MRVEARQAGIAEVETDLLVVGLHQGEQLPEGLEDAAGAADARGAYRRLTTIHPETPARALVVGLGKAEEMDAERARVAAALAAQEAARLEAKSVAWLLPASGDDAATAEGLVTGTILGSYRFDRFRTPDPDDPAPPEIESLTLVGTARCRRGRRGGAGLRRGPEQGPRPSEPSLQRRHSLLPRPPRPRDRLRPHFGHHRSAGPRRDDREGDGRPARGQPGLGRGAAADRDALRGGGPGRAGRAGRQGGHLRHRRDLDQALRGHARHEVRHVRCCHDALQTIARDRRARVADRRARASCPRPRTCPPAPRSSPGTSSPRSTARRSRCTTPTPRAA